jgi:hypothetical protein
MADTYGLSHLPISNLLLYCFLKNETTHHAEDHFPLPDQVLQLPMAWVNLLASVSLSECPLPTAVLGMAPHLADCRLTNHMDLIRLHLVGGWRSWITLS